MDFSGVSSETLTALVEGYEKKADYIEGARQELNRRLVEQGKLPDPEITAMLRKEHAERYGVAE